MSDEGRSVPDQSSLAIHLRITNPAVSYLSSLLRVVQAALREVARSDDGTRQRFDQRPEPTLLLSRLSTSGDLTLHFTFADPLDSTPLLDFSSQAFDAFLDQFIDYIKGMPQPGLWGGASTRPAQRGLTSELTMRMDQVHRELRRSPKATMMFGGRSIEIEGDRMDILQKTDA